MLTRVMFYATTVCSTRVVRVGLCVRSFGRGFLPIYESREVSTGQAWDHVVHYTITQLSMKAGLKIWGNKGKQAVSNELSRLHMRDTFRPINSKTLSKTEYDKVLEYHMFLK